MHDIAIQATVLEGSERHDTWLTNDCQGYGAIDCVIDAGALVCAGRGDLRHACFKGLVARADKDDLREVSLSNLEGSERGKFRAAIESAVTKTDVGGTRLNFSVMTAWMTGKILGKDRSIGMPRGITGTILIPCITGEQLPGRRDVGVEEGGEGS